VVVGYKEENKLLCKMKGFKFVFAIFYFLIRFQNFHGNRHESGGNTALRVLNAYKSLLEDQNEWDLLLQQHIHTLECKIILEVHYATMRIQYLFIGLLFYLCYCLNL
jgi:hypothetical protein